MNDRDRAAFVEALAGVHAVYRAELTPTVTEIWWRALKQHDIEAVRDALGRHVVNPDAGQFLPKPADVVRMMSGSTKDSALVAWTKVETAVERAGSWSSVAFDDPIIHRVIHEMGGWYQMTAGTKDLREWPFKQREFMDRYRAFKVRGETPEYPRRLIGTADAENEAQGYPSGRLIMIGDPAEVQKVLAGGTEAPLIGVRHVAQTARALLDKPRGQG